jgi:tetrahydromethanopterin S-methyltransferase subunit B
MKITPPESTTTRTKLKELIPHSTETTHCFLTKNKKYRVVVVHLHSKEAIMGCWNTSFWDNDECVDFLLLLFQHMALIPFPPRQERISRAYAIEFPGAEFTTFVRHSNDEFDIVQRMLASITKITLQRAKGTDTRFKQKLIQDAASPEMNLVERLQEQTGLTMDHMWTIIHMHVGATVDDIQELDALADAFLFEHPPAPTTRRSPRRGTYKISAYLTNFGMSDGWIKEQIKIQATAIYAGVMRYKESMLLNSSIQGGMINNHQDNLVEPLKLQFWGVQNTIALVRGEGKADLSVPQNIWNINAAAEEFENPGLRHVDIDATIDDIKCSNCHTPGRVGGGPHPPVVVGEDSPPLLLVCSCGCVTYCRKFCQARIIVIKAAGGWSALRVIIVDLARCRAKYVVCFRPSVFSHSSHHNINSLSTESPLERSLSTSQVAHGIL